MDNPRFLSLGGGHPRHFLSSGGNLVNGDSCKIICMMTYLLVFTESFHGQALITTPNPSTDNGKSAPQAENLGFEA